MSSKTPSFIILALLTGLCRYAAGQSFTHVTDHPVVDILQQSHGVAWGDYDDDGDQDLFLANYKGPNQLFRNDGGGVFTEINPGSVFDKSDPETITVNATWGDYNNDGFLDLYVANQTDNSQTSPRRNLIYQYNGDGTFTVVNDLANTTFNTYGVSWVDYNADGNLDATEADYPRGFLYTNNGGSGFSGAQLTGTNSVFFNGVSWSDFDNDGYPELFGAAGFGANVLYDNNGAALSLINTGPVVADALDSYGGSWADYDNDGDFDLFVTNGGSGTASRNQLFRNDNGTFTKISTGDIATDQGESRGSSWGDYDNDGFIDLFVANAGVESALYKNNGDGSFSKITGVNIVTGANFARGCTWIDYNQDGFLDLYMTDFNGSRENVLFENDGNANHWAAVKLKGVVSNRAAIGAKVRTRAVINGSPVWQAREISGQSGFAAQAGLFAHFGMGDAAVIDTLMIEWPSGIVQSHYNLPVDQLHTIEEIEPPVAPNDLLATAQSSTEVDLTWTDLAIAEDDYIVYRSEGDNSNYQIVAQLGPDASSFEDSGLTGGTTYFYRVAVVNASGTEYSNEVDVDTDPAPVNAPSGLIANATGPEEIELSWTDNSPDETGFILERTTASDPPVIINIPADQTSYIDTDNLEEETEYSYRIKATIGGGESSYSNSVNVTTPPHIYAPDNIAAAAAGHDQIDLTWSDNSNNETGFVIERSLTSGSGFAALDTTAADAVSYSDTENLDPSTEYFYRIKAINLTHESQYTAEVSAVTDDYNPVTLAIPDGYEQPGEEVIVPVTVNNFNDVLALQLTVTWDPAVLQFEEVTDDALTDMDFGEDFVTSGALTLLWFDNMVVARSLPDGTTLFNIHFTAIGADGTFSAVEIPEDGAGYTPLEFADGASQVMDVETTGGVIDILSMASISGVITTPAGDEVANVTVNLSGDDNQSTTTGTDGSFSFGVLPGAAVQIVPEKNTEPAANNGVTTLDIALIRRHLITSHKFSGDPYQLIAADVNGMGDVSVTDLPLIRKVILAQETSFNGRLWKFIPSDHAFADPDNPWPFIEERVIPSAVTSSDLHFIGVRLGDVNYSWDKTNARNKSGKTLEIDIPNQEPEPQETLSVPLIVRNFSDISAFQFTVKWDADAMEFVDISENPLSSYYSAHRAADGLLTIAWDETSGKSVSLPDGSTMMELTFNLKQKDISGFIQINSELTQSIAYDADLKEVDILQSGGVVRGKDTPGSVTTKIHQNYPNPFDANGTRFRFDLAESGPVRLTIFNAIGKTISELERTFEAGANTIEWKPSGDLQDGVYFYRIETADGQFTKRMLQHSE